MGGVRGEARLPPNAAIIWGIFIIQYKFPIIANIGNRQAFWGVVKMTPSF